MLVSTRKVNVAKEKRELNVRTVYYRHREVVRTIPSGAEINAVKNAVGWMRVNRYEATHCEVYGVKNGKLYGVIVNSLVNGKLRTRIEYEHSETRAINADLAVLTR